jgi:hypothetical protein
MDKPWRLHLANSAILHLDVIAGDPPLLAIWARDGKVSFCDLERGAAHGTASYMPPEQHENLRLFAASLKDTKDRQLSYARISGRSFWPLPDGSLLEYAGGAKVELHDANAGGVPVTLRFDVTPRALAVDPKTLLIAAVDSKGALLLGKIGGTVKTLKPGLAPSDDLPISIVVARGGKRIIVSDGAHLIVIDSGKVIAKRDLHYVCGLLALSPSGEYLMTFDSDSGVLRAYQPDGLVLSHQRFVSDLLSAADELQLTGFAELPPSSAAVSALTIDDQGRFAFAVFGQICGSPLSAMTSTGAPVGGAPAAMPKPVPSKLPAEPKPEQKPAQVQQPPTPAATPEEKKPGSSKGEEKPASKPPSVTGGSERSSNVRPAPKPAPKRSAPVTTLEEDDFPVDPPHSDD